MLPNQVRYQTALHPATPAFYGFRGAAARLILPA